MTLSPPHPEFLIGIDCGTTALKGVLCAADGRELARAQRPIPLLTPEPGWAEQDPEAVWRALRDVARELAPHLGGGSAALAIGAQAGSILPANADGRPIGPMITFLDSRAAGIVAAWASEGWNDEIRRITGWGLQIGQPLASIEWMRRNQPDAFAAAHRFIGPHDDLVRRLTGVLISNPSCGAQMPLIDRLTGAWSAEVAARVGLSVARLPPLGRSGDAIGPLRPAVVAELGLPPATLVVNGGQDHACEALALGLTEPGEFMLATGTAWVITGVVDSPDIDRIPPQMDLNAHVVPNRWTISTYMGGYGAIVEWWLNATPGLGADKYAALERALATAPPGAHGLRFAPESQARPASTFEGLKLSHTWDDMTRAIVEGATRDVRAMIDALRAANLPVRALHMLGGAAKSAGWQKTLAEIAGVPIRARTDPYLGARGAAMLAHL